MMNKTLMLLMVTVASCGAPVSDGASVPDEASAQAEEEIAHETPQPEGSAIAGNAGGVDCTTPPGRPRCPPGEHATDQCNRQWEQVWAWERACGPEAPAQPEASVDCAQPEPDHPRCPPSGLGSSPECQRAWEPVLAWQRACRPT